MKHKLASWWKTIKLTANLMAGVPDYENYVARQRKHNPNAPVMTELQFQDYCRKRRCGSNKILSDGLSLWNINKNQKLYLVINI